ncbi:uncharacterized protein T551_00154 [Pneumocystis jirovecii RU7]|uniref:RRM domain-containing protein n=1 Tax=Pneumocystis jirovecii (strain RU7) TaxID=1408657 RepID=A0A0W4ZWC0_PNEJ7|nr:uncharacterized protein T551_00154 [Pneumocystis jirovecii RU7]KTW32669.1 hypothetical protein T551_00154 [Pneumocystis jirovecii RU7]
MASKPPSKVVFVGNIPYDVSEEQLKDIFRQIGPINRFRLVFDKETNKPKGYGFCEYPDVATASAAVRNLNNHDINGRQLRVDFAESDPAQDNNRRQQQSSVQHEEPSLQQNKSDILPPLPQGTMPQPGISVIDAISRTLSTLPPLQLLDIISQLKALVHINPEQAHALLLQSPQLSYAVFQAMLMMNLVEASVLQRVVASTGLPQPSQPSQASNTSYTQSQQNISEQQKAAIYAQVMSLTDAQINTLPADTRNQILLLKQQIAMGVV